jgi:fucose permease
MIVYGVSGFALASWGSRLPAIQKIAHLSGEHVGLIVAALAAGALAALLLAGQVVKRLGSRRTVWLGDLICVVALLAVAVRPTGAVFGVAAILLGFGNALYDVAMNVQGAATGHRKKYQRLMPTLHGAWSVGALLGSFGGAAAALWQIPLALHLAVVAVVIAVGGVLGAARFDQVPGPPRQGRARAGHRSGVSASDRPRLWAAWRSRRTVSLGLLALGAAFAEGSANDWLTLALVDKHGYALTHQAAAAGLGIFVVGMIAGRFGSLLIPHCYRLDQLLILSVALVVVGTALVLAGGLVLVNVSQMIARVAGGVGLMAWGLGAALGVPMAMAAAAVTHPSLAPDSLAPDRVGVVSTIGYAAFLGGPPLLGWLADDVGFLWTLAAAPVGMVAAMLVAAMFHPLGLSRRAGAMVGQDNAAVELLTLQQRTSEPAVTTVAGGSTFQDRT